MVQQVSMAKSRARGGEASSGATFTAAATRASVLVHLLWLLVVAGGSLLDVQLQLKLLLGRAGGGRRAAVFSGSKAAGVQWERSGRQWRVRKRLHHSRQHLHICRRLPHPSRLPPASSHLVAAHVRVAHEEEGEGLAAHHLGRHKVQLHLGLALQQ